MTKGKRGFTLIELIVVIAIISVLAAISVPSLVILMEKGREGADIASVKILNDATAEYRAMLSAYTDDVFSGIDTNEARMQTILDAGLMGGIPQPQQPGASFDWNVSIQSWVLSASS